jgi:hypothetical protein
MTPRLHRLAAAAGIVGPAAFTAAWLISGTRQAEEYSHRHEHISGLAAQDARNPEILTAGFVEMGVATIVFAVALRERLGGRKAGLGPILLGLTGLGAIGAGIFRRDRLLLHPPDQPPDHRQSWRNDGHDAAAALIYASSVAAPLFLYRHLRNDPRLSAMAPVGIALSTASLGLMAFFAVEVDRPHNGIVQRVMVSLPMGFMFGVAVRMLTD